MSVQVNKFRSKSDGVLRTCFRQVESLLEQVGHQPKDGDKPSQRRADNIEIDQRERRHVACSTATIQPSKGFLLASSTAVLNRQGL